MAKKISTPNVSPKTVNAPTPKLPKPKALEVNSPLLSSEVNGTVATSRMKGSYLIFDPRMDEDKPVTVKFRTTKTPGPVFEDIEYPSATPGAGRTEIPLHYMTAAMEYTLVITYTGTVNGQAAASLDKEVFIDFYLASEVEEFAPYFLHEKMVQNTPTFDMHDFKGDGIVKTKLPYLAQVGDQFYCTLVTLQFSGKPAVYEVDYGYRLTDQDIALGELTHAVSRAWLARQKPQYESMTLQCAYITSGLEAQPPVEVPDANQKTFLPENALQIQIRRTAAFIGDQDLGLPPAHLRQSVLFNDEWYLNPELTTRGGNVYIPDLKTYADDQLCFYVSGSDYGNKPLGCVTIKHNGELATTELSPCVIACFFNKPMALTYTVQFPHSNGPRQSPERVINVLLPRFPLSEIEQATGDILDLSTFAMDATAFVPVWNYAECSNLCWMWITGERENGSAYRFDILSDAPVNEDWKVHGVDARIPREVLLQLADCSEFKLHFAASFCEATALADAHEFPAQAFNIEQEPLVLAAPKVTEAVGTDLTAWNGREGVHVEVSYTGKHPKHSISLCWERPEGTCWPLASKPGSAVGAVIFSLPREAVIESMGKTVAITYTVTTACKVQTSLPLNVKISKPVRLPTPVIPQATPPVVQGGILDLATFSGDASIAVEKWWFALAGQKVWLRCIGTKQDGKPYTITVSSSKALTDAEAGGGLVDLLPRNEIELLKDESDLTVLCKVTVDGNVVESEAIVFPTLTLKVRTKKQIHYENFDNHPDRLIEAGGSIDEPGLRMKITLLPGSPGVSGIHKYIYASAGPAIVVAFNEPDLNPQQKVQLDFRSLYVRIQFSVFYLHLHARVIFFDEQDEEIGVHALVGGSVGGSTNQTVDFSAPAGTKIKRMIMEVGDYAYLDSFVLWE